MKNWQALREALEEERVESWFRQNEVDVETAEQAWYLCEYYLENTKPFLKQMSEGNKLDEERKILRILQKTPNMRLNHSKLFNKTGLNKFEFRKSIEGLIERQAILPFEEEVGYRNLMKMSYILNPVLGKVELN